MAEAKKSFLGRHRWLVWLAGAAVVVLAAIAVLLSVAARRFEPYLRAQIVAGLEERFHAHVELDGFHVQVNNVRKGEWGIWATGTGLRIWPPMPVDGVQALDTASGAPLISLGSFSFHVPLRWEQAKNLRIGEIDLDALHVRVPPRSQRAQLKANAQQRRQATGEQTSQPQPAGQQIKIGGLQSILIEKIVCSDTELVLETDKPGKLPMGFVLPHLVLTNVTPGGAMHYVADLDNPKPKGMIHTQGSFGPWVTEDPGESAVSGSYHMNPSDMGVFKGIGGTITSDGDYTGTLRELHVTGTANVPDFKLTHFGNQVPLDTKFDARVDGTDGDTWLNQVNATLGHSQFTTNGQIVRMKINTDAQAAAAPEGALQMAKAGGHAIDLAVNIPHGQMEDFLKLTSKSATQMLTGALSLKAQLAIPPGAGPVEDRIKLDGEFHLSGARFTSEKIQAGLQQLSLRGQGRPQDLKTENPTLVRSEMQSSFHMAHGVIGLPDLKYSVPGADIDMNGSYALDGALNFSGTAKLQATVSEAVGGWKGLLLKPADKFFEKNGAGTLVPITIKGTREQPEFGLDKSRMSWTGTRAERPDTKK